MKFTDLTNLVGITNTQNVKPVEPEHVIRNRDDLGPKKSLLSWTAKPEITLTKLDPRYKRTFLVVAVILGVLLVLMQEYFLIIVVASLVFIYQALSTNTDVGEFKYEITTHGINVNGTFYYWDELTVFFFASQFGSEVLAVDLKSGLPGRLFITYRPKDKELLVETLNRYLKYLEKEPTTVIDQAYTKLVDKFDFEKKK